MHVHLHKYLSYIHDSLNFLSYILLSIRALDATISSSKYIESSADLSITRFCKQGQSNYLRRSRLKNPSTHRYMIDVEA